MSVKPIPEGYHSVTPYLIVRGGGAAIEYYQKAFGAVELFRIPAPGGTVGHAEIKIGDSIIMLADEHPSMGYTGPETIGGSPVSLMIYVEDVDTVFERAVSAGATVKQALEDKFYGDRSGTVVDLLDISGTSRLTKKTFPLKRWSVARKNMARRPRAAASSFA